MSCSISTAVGIKLWPWPRPWLRPWPWSRAWQGLWGWAVADAVAITVVLAVAVVLAITVVLAVAIVLAVGAAAVGVRVCPALPWRQNKGEDKASSRIRAVAEGHRALFS